ncbi:MAG: peptidoglycan glycosyltransferase [Lachnospiraceae bacterium]|nr:peptidoglycan glycosyltransferase [Lachnospiraceae bacterium]
MQRLKIYQKRKAFVLLCVSILILTCLVIRVVFLVIYGTRFDELALQAEQRERRVKAARGIIYDRNGVVLADNIPVCTVSVIHSQITDEEEVISTISEILELDEETVRTRVTKNSSIEIIKTNVSLELGEEIKAADLDGVKVDTDYRRYYPYPEIMSRLLGFTGSDNQGVVGLETTYDEILQGEDGAILTFTDATGVELADAEETRDLPVDGDNLYLTIDYNVQKYINNVAYNTLSSTGGKSVSILVMNPQNGEIYGMTTVPEYNNQTPFVLYDGTTGTDMDVLNEMWRNPLVSDTYEPGSSFKVVTATTALSEGVCSLSDGFYCSGCKIVADRRIHCHELDGHGSVSFADALAKSCNVALMDIGQRVGTEMMYNYFDKLGLLERTGIDLPGEANSIMHNIENVKEVELATMSFGQSFQITPLQLVRAVSCAINGGTLVTPHVGMAYSDSETTEVTTLTFPTESGVISSEVSETMRDLLLNVVDNGTGNKAAVEGYLIGGKTATSEKLPRSENKYIASFVGFAPADDPQVLVFVMIDEPQGLYYGGTIAAPVAAEVFENILPYMGIEKTREQTD